MSYAIWFPFELPSGKSFKDTPHEFEMLGFKAQLIKHEYFYVVEVRGVPSLDQAEAMIPNIEFGLKYAALDTGLGAKISQIVDKVTLYDDPEKAAENLLSEKPVHGMRDANRICVYPEQLNIKKLTGLPVSFHQAYNPIAFTTAIDEVKGFSAPDKSTSEKESLNLAIEIYCLSDFESSAQAKFLVLCMALDVVSPQPEQSQVIIGELDKWIEESKALAASPTLGGSDQEVFDNLANGLRNFKTISHRQAVYNFVLQMLQGEDNPSAEEIAKEARDLYDKRGLLVHDAKLELAQEVNRLKQIVGMTLCAAMVATASRT